MKRKENQSSWFRDTPHYWPTDSLPLAYAMACVEVVSKESEKAGYVYSQIVENWGKPGLKALSDTIISEAPDSELDKVKNALLHTNNNIWLGIFLHFYLNSRYFDVAMSANPIIRTTVWLGWKVPKNVQAAEPRAIPKPA